MIDSKLIFFGSPIALAAIAAVCYVSATFAMKTFSLNTSFVAACLIFAFMVVGISAEIIAMTRVQLGILYILILGLEVLLVVTVSVVILKESYTAREILGLIMICVGIATLFDRN